MPELMRRALHLFARIQLATVAVALAASQFRIL